MTQDLQKQVKEHSEKNVFSRTWANLFGSTPPSNANEILAHPETSFDTLEPENQAKYLQACLSPQLIRELQTKLASSVRPPQCALDSMARDLEQLKKEDANRGVFGKVSAFLFGGSAPANADQLLAQPDMGFLSLEAGQREKYLADCPPDTLLGDIGMNLSTPPPAPQCALDAMTREVTRLKEEAGSRSWIGSLFASWTGNEPPANADEILAQPQKAFESLNDQDRLKFIAMCSPDDLQKSLFAVQRAGASDLIAAPTADGIAPSTPLASQHAPASPKWPPQCAVDAMAGDISQSQKEYEAKGWLGKGFSWFVGNTPPSNASEILTHPVASFLALDRVSQEKYLARCAPTDLNRELSTGPTSAGGLDPLRSSAPTPQCAIDALTKDITKQKKEDADRWWITRQVTHLFGGGPPSNAGQLLANPSDGFAKLDRDQQVQYLYECAPQWIKCTGGEEPGFFGRIRNYLHNMGFLGKTLLVLGSALAGAVLWRIRGGFLPTGSTQTARLIGTLPLALLGGLLMGPMGFAAGLSMFATTALFGWGSYMGIANGKQLWQMGLRGIWQTAIPGILASAAGASPAYILAGVLMAPLYYAANKFGPNIFPNAGHGGFAHQGPEVGEVYTGAMLYGLFVLAALHGGGHPPIVPGGNCPGKI